MMEVMSISLDARVFCTDAPIGHIKGLVLNPITTEMTHIVVQERRAPYLQRLVPIEWVGESTPQYVHLRCTTEELSEMQEFIETVFIESQIAGYMGVPHPVQPRLSAAMAHIPPKERFIALEHEHTPPGELCLHQGTQVEAIDGYVGPLSSFLVDPGNNHVSYLTLPEGHLWHRKNVSIPVSEVQHWEEDTVYLKLDRHGIEMLPVTQGRKSG